MSTRALLTPSLLEAIQRGDAILFLGAGASFGAKGPKGQVAPSGEQLRDILCDRFLGGTLNSKSLSQVAELAKNEAGLLKVQDTIAELFRPLEPADFHLLIPSFRWHAIVTTNFDLVLERAYDKCRDREQSLAPVLRDGDNFIDRLRDLSQVLYLKLHGCITHINDESLPLIVASEEYARHRKNRERLFRHFQDWGRERPIVFCGYDVGDPHIQQILFDLSDLGILRPQFGMVSPDLNEIVARYWAAKRFSVCAKTFEDFMWALNTEIPRSSRRLSGLLKAEDTSVQPWIKTHVAPSSFLLAYLQDELVHVHKGMAVTGVAPVEFYRGLSVDWGAFQQELDVYRRVSDDIILAAFLENKKAKYGQAYVLKGHAGSGKSVTLCRIAWDLAHLFDGLVFVLKEGAILRRDRLFELHTLTGERINVVIEDAIPHIKDILDVIAWAEKNKIPITLVFGARTNEWNVYAGELEGQTEDDYELRDLTEREITQLIEKLSLHKALGRLATASAEERFEHFQLTAERQLLVALHDISGEKPFEEIVFDEYRNVRPAEARLLYLDVCTLHRLGVGVRAGLISRISGITFEYFSRDFFRPLEHVVRTYFDHSSRDNMYRSRHQLIAEMVFKQAMPNPVERANQIIRIIRNIDVDYASDKSAFTEIVRGRVLADLFANKVIAFQIFDAAKESGAPLSFIEHQRAVFEMHHPSRNLHAAMEAIERAEAALEHTDRAILHTKATILRSLALEAPQKLARENLRVKAKVILQKQIRGSRVSHPFHLTGQLLIDELKDKLNEIAERKTPTVSVLEQRAIAELIRNAEEVISEGMQRFPGDEYLLTLEAELARLLEDEKRAIDALAQAFEASPGRSFIAVRLAYHEQRKGDIARAVEILKRSIGANSASKEAHLAMARILMSQDEESLREDVAHHLKRSFTSGDSNFDAQFWYARHHFLYGDRNAAMACFRQLADSWTPPEYRKGIKDVVHNKDGSRRRLSGSVKNVESSYCFIRCPDLRTDMFAHMSQFKEQDWMGIGHGALVSFELGFSLRGPQALNVRMG
ncbi:MAG: hypothetical protein EPO31_01010 [Gammaproteobacteria bacterium]|nr:MAG: hypothetical protein EPO31_01010 [Gammaproteobacteria bacterium]